MDRFVPARGAGRHSALTQFLLDTADALKKYSGDPLVSAGHNIHQAIFQTAIVMALLVAVPPILLVLLPYAGWRWRDMRETGAALAFVQDRVDDWAGGAGAGGAGVSGCLDFELPAIDVGERGTGGDIAERRYDRLADAMIKRAGLGPDAAGAARPAGAAAASGALGLVGSRPRYRCGHVSKHQDSAPG